MSIRLRLSLFYSVILALTLVVVGIVLYTTQSQYTLSWLKQDLVVSSETLSQSIVQTYLYPKLPGSNEQTTAPPPPLSLTNNQAFQHQSQQEVVRVLGPDGNLIASPIGSADITLPLNSTGLEALHRMQDWWETDTVAGQRLLIYNRPVVFQGQLVSILQVARALTERDQSLQALARTLMIAVLVAILTALGMGWLLAGASLQPIRRISQTAQAIGSERDFTRRVAYTGPQDEVGQLALTFNSMLAQLQNAYQKVAHSLEMQRNFVADVSHELRTPLTTLRGNLGLLGRTPPLSTEDQADALKDMVEESDRLIRLVNELLLLARADAGRNLAKEPVTVRPVMEETCRQAHSLDPQRLIALDVQQDLTVAGDRDAIKQILLIVLDNAIKHSRGAIRLSAEAGDARVLFRVQDVGEGIPPGQLEHVFDRFYHGYDPTDNHGLGLGLSIARALVEGQGGTITIESTVGQGSTLLFSLPGAG
jgi:signal transduction histidine kinase